MMPKVFFGQVDLEVLRGLFQAKSYDLSTRAQGCALGGEQRSESGRRESSTIQVCNGSLSGSRWGLCKVKQPTVNTTPTGAARESTAARPLIIHSQAHA
jgi:hypothetical protein